jgi:SAM-dependent methyltransferase
MAMSNKIMGFTERLLMDAGIRKGMRILDVGCGSGDVSFLLSDLIDRQGEIIGVDHDPQALAVARQRSAARGQPAVTFLQHDLLELPDSIGTFDVIVGRRVLMYQRDAIETIHALSRFLKPDGVVVFQEHDTTMVPASLHPFPLHEKAQRWIQEMIAREGADLHIGFHLHGLFTRAGLRVESVRAECLVQTPDTPYHLGDIVRACLPRITALGVASAAEVGIETLQQRLDEERSGSPDIYIGDMMFGSWARKI